MRKLLFILVLTPFLFSFSCSNDDDKTVEDTNTNVSVNQLSGTWNLTAKYNSGSFNNSATSCELQYGKFTFGPSAVEKRGLQATDCSEQSYTYSDYNIVNGQLKLVRNNVTYIYNMEYSSTTLILTKVSSQPSSGSITIIPVSEQVRLQYSK